MVLTQIVALKAKKGQNTFWISIWILIFPPHISSRILWSWNSVHTPRISSKTEQHVKEKPISASQRKKKLLDDIKNCFFSSAAITDLFLTKIIGCTIYVRFMSFGKSIECRNWCWIVKCRGSPDSTNFVLPGNRTMRGLVLQGISYWSVKSNSTLRGRRSNHFIEL